MYANRIIFDIYSYRYISFPSTFASIKYICKSLISDLNLAHDRFILKLIYLIIILKILFSLILLLFGFVFSDVICYIYIYVYIICHSVLYSSG